MPFIRINSYRQALLLSGYTASRMPIALKNRRKGFQFKGAIFWQSSVQRMRINIGLRYANPTYDASN